MFWYDLWLFDAERILNPNVSLDKDIFVINIILCPCKKESSLQIKYYYRGGGFVSQIADIEGKENL